MSYAWANVVCNSVFNLIWKIVKPWLNEQTLSKITILGTNYREQLHKAIDPANLPDVFIPSYISPSYTLLYHIPDYVLMD
jgi:hypothetical protein